MAKKKLDKTKLVKEMARERVGSPPSSRIVEDKRKKEKYKRDWREDYGGRGNEKFNAPPSLSGMVAFSQTSSCA